MRIIFMGTPDFAVASLRSLFENGLDIVGVITATDKYGGRGKNVLIESAVKRYALSKGLRILQPANLKNAMFVEEVRSLGADLQIVVAFRMLPEVIWSMPPLGTYNLHASLLPKYRGAAPINWAIINGEETTGVTTFKLKHEIDTGSLAFQQKVAISPVDTAGTLHDRLMEVGASIVLKTVRAIQDEHISLLPQTEEGVSKAPKIFHQDCFISFDQDTLQVYNYIRGLSPYPTAWTYLDTKKLKIFSVLYTYEVHSLSPGTIRIEGRDVLKIACTNGFIYCMQIQLEGKRKMSITDFLNGYNATGYN